MKAWLLDEFDGLPKLRFAEAPEPRAAAGEVVLAVKFAALNPADRYLAEGQYPARPPLPHILGRDGMGTIVEVGPGVSGLSVGQKQVLLRGDVGITRAGTFAERVAMPVESLVAMPDDWTDEESAGAALVYITAYQALTQWGDLPSPAAVLITGASGGVGAASTQLAFAMGHTVVAQSRDPVKREKLKAMGAALTIDPQESNWRQRVKEFLGKRRVDLAIDSVGGPLLSDVVDSLGYNGKVSVVGRLAGPVPQFNTASLLFRRVKIGGVAVGTYTNAESRAAWSAILRLLKTASVRPLVDSVFPFDQLPAAFTKLEQGPMGKVLLRMG